MGNSLPNIPLLHHSYHQSGLVLEIPPHNHLAEDRWQRHHGLPYDAFLVHAERGVYLVPTKQLFY